MPEDLPVATVATTVAVLQTLVDHGEASVATLAADLDLPKSTVHDHLRTLELLDLVVNDGGTYRPGTRFLSVGDAARRALPVYGPGRRAVDDLVSEVGDHAALVVPEHGETVVVYVRYRNSRPDPAAVESGDPATDPPELGARAPLPDTPAGLAILATLAGSECEIRSAAGESTAAESASTGLPAGFEPRLAEICDRGYALAVEDGRATVAVALVTGDTVHGALSVGVPVGPDDRRVDDTLVERLLETASSVEADVAGRG